MAYRVLVINDDLATLNMYVNVLTFSGYEVTTRAAPETIVADLQELQPDVVIVDWLDEHEALGLPAIEALLSHGLSRQPSLIVCSAAVPEVKEARASLLAQGVQVLYKPLEIHMLQAALTQAIQSEASI